MKSYIKFPRINSDLLIINEPAVIYKKERYNRIKKDVIKVLQKNYKKLEDTGHGILSASFYINTVGLPEEYVLGHVHKHYSNYNNY